MIKRKLIRGTCFLAGSLMVLCILLSACQDCDEDRVTEGYILTEAEKAWVPYSEKDTVWYVNQQGQRFYAAFNESSDYATTNCYLNCCASCECYGRVSLRLYFRKANAVTNISLLGTSYSPVEISSGVSGGRSPEDSAKFHILLKNTNLPWGSKVSASVDAIIDKANADNLHTNAKFLPQLTLNGTTYQHVFYQVYAQEATVDSIYFNKKQGLIRFTTIHGDAYTLAR